MYFLILHENFTYECFFPMKRFKDWRKRYYEQIFGINYSCKIWYPIHGIKATNCCIDEYQDTQNMFIFCHFGGIIWNTVYTSSIIFSQNTFVVKIQWLFRFQRSKIVEKINSNNFNRAKSYFLKFSKKIFLPCTMHIFSP